MRFFSAAMILLSFCIPALGQDNTKTFTYTKTKQADLEIVVHHPPGWKESDKRPGIVFFFGGGWENGTIKAFEPQAQYLASRGMVAARADYRVKSRHGVTPKECVDDARTAMRWFRHNAAKLGVDPNKIVASGGSAGGHIAACTTLMPASELKDEKVSCKANALLLFNPVLRFGPQMLKKLNNDEAVGKAISPILYLAKDSPPTLLFFGTDDFLFKQGEEFIQRSKELGHRSEMFTAEKQPHAFFHKSPWKEKTLQRADEFLVSLGYLQGKPTIQVPDGRDERPKPKDALPGAKVIRGDANLKNAGQKKAAQDTNSQEKKPPEGLQVGEEMPVHVVTFIAGARKDGAGCPSIMISNAKAQGVEIWSRTDDDQPFQLACALEAKLGDGKKKQGFLILFKDSLKKSMAAKPDALKKFQVAVPRGTGLFNDADPSGKAGSVVFLLNRKTITAVWRFAPGELTKERIEAIVKQFAAEKD